MHKDLGPVQNTYVERRMYVRRQKKHKHRGFSFRRDFEAKLFFFDVVMSSDDDDDGYDDDDDDNGYDNDDDDES